MNRTTPPIANWITAIIIVLAVGWVAAQDDGPPPADDTTAAQQEAQAVHSRDWAARQVCGMQSFEWADDTTLVCHRPAAVVTAKVQP